MEYEKPFAHGQELEEKLKRQSELNEQLDLENRVAVEEAPGGGREWEGCLEGPDGEGAYQIGQGSGGR